MSVCFLVRSNDYNESHGKREDSRILLLFTFSAVLYLCVLCGLFCFSLSHIAASLQHTKNWLLDVTFSLFIQKNKTESSTKIRIKWNEIEEKEWGFYKGVTDDDIEFV